MNETEISGYLERFQGRFRGVPRWQDLDALWAKLRNTQHDAWYIYAVGEEPPAMTVSKEKMVRFVDEMDKLLRAEHREDYYCGIVYADSLEDPSFVKIFDPNNLGSVCGTGALPPPLPGWVLSTIKPENLQNAFPPTASRKRWWNSIFS